jgi:hypothetical protein
VGAGERDEWLRAAWRAFVAGALAAHRLAFVDEMGTSTSLAPCMTGRDGESERSVRRRATGESTSRCSRAYPGRDGPCLAVEGATTGEVFEAYLEWVLKPSLKPGQVAVLGNLSSHKGSGVRELIEGRGRKLSRTCCPTRRTSTPSKKRPPS